MKKEISLKGAHRLVNTGSVLLITSSFNEKNNIMSLAWQTPLSASPLLLGISVARAHYTHELIKNSMEFVINVPGWELLEKVIFCGKNKGRETDKFAGSGLKAVKAPMTGVPFVDDCLAYAECRVLEGVEAGDHTFFIGEVLSAYADEEKFNGTWQKGTKLIHHLGGPDFYPGIP